MLAFICKDGPYPSLHQEFVCNDTTGHSVKETVRLGGQEAIRM